MTVSKFWLGAWYLKLQLDINGFFYVLQNEEGGE
jgi:hypothetical protein